jgi:hypothetical protein
MQAEQGNTMKYLIMLSLIMFGSSVLASGGGGYRGGGGISGDYSSRSVDEIYEAGKHIYNGRNKTYEKLKICVVDEAAAEKVKIKSKIMKTYKGKKLELLAHNLFDCKNPEQKILGLLTPDDMNLVLYYLNKRYKLKLTT